MRTALLAEDIAVLQLTPFLFLGNVVHLLAQSFRDKFQGCSPIHRWSALPAPSLFCLRQDMECSFESPHWLWQKPQRFVGNE